MGAPQHVVAVVVGRAHLRAEGAEVERQVFAGLDLNVEQAAGAHALLFEQRRADQHLVPDAGQVGVRGCHRRARLVLLIAQQLLAIAAQVARLLEGLEQHADGVAFVLPVDERVELRVGLLGQVGIDEADRGFEGERLLEVQRLCALLLDEEQARLLEAKAGDAGLLVERVGYLRDGRTVEISQSYYRGDTYDFVAELSTA